MKTAILISFTGLARQRRVRRTAAVLLLGLFCFIPSQAASPPELLEKAIYQEETKGDIDAAIKLYREIVADAKTTRIYGAQAQYRLGLCYHKKGNYAAARAAFESLINEFPDQAELAAMARKYLPGELALGPVPWKSGEVHELEMKFPTGFKIGAGFYRVDKVQHEGREVWRTENRQYAGVHAYSHVWIEAGTLRPIRSYWKHSLIGEVAAVYSEKQITLENRLTGNTQEVELSKNVYDNEEVIQLARCLPLEVGYTTKLQLMTTLGGGMVVPIQLKVTARETVRVPAGEFDCFKIEYDVQQSFWYSADAQRRLVKFEAGGIVAELTRVYHHPLEAPMEYRDEELGCRMTIPAGWQAFKREPDDGDPKAVVTLLEPEATAKFNVIFIALEEGAGGADEPIRSQVEAQLLKLGKRLKEFRVRENSWQESERAGLAAVGASADFSEGEQAMSFEAVFLRSPHFTIGFTAQGPLAQERATASNLKALLASFTLLP